MMMMMMMMLWRLLRHRQIVVHQLRVMIWNLLQQPHLLLPSDVVAFLQNCLVQELQIRALPIRRHCADALLKQQLQPLLPAVVFGAHEPFPTVLTAGSLQGIWEPNPYAHGPKHFHCSVLLLLQMRPSVLPPELESSRAVCRSPSAVLLPLVGSPRMFLLLPHQLSSSPPPLDHPSLPRSSFWWWWKKQQQ